MKKAILTLLFLSPIYTLSAMESLPEMVVTAQRQPLLQKEVSQSVEVVTAKDIERMGASNVSEALSLAMGLDLSRGSQNSTSAMGGHQLMLRGMNTNQTLVLVDGYPLADEDTGQTKNVYLLSRLDVSQVERIEVLRGAAGAMYGSDAMGGVIQIFMKKPGNEGGTYGWQVGSRENTTHFRYDGRGEGRWQVAMNGRITKVRPISFKNKGPDSRGVMYDGYDTPSYGNRQQVGVDVLYDFQNRNQNTLRFTTDYFHEKMTLRMADATMTLSQMTQESGMPSKISDLVPPISIQKNATNRTERKEWSTSLTYAGETDRNQYEGRIYYSQLDKNSWDSNDRPGAEALDLSGLAAAHYPPAMLETMKQRLQERLDTIMPTIASDHGRYDRYGIEGRDTMTFNHHHLTWGGEWTRQVYQGTRLISQINHPGEEARHSRQETALYVSDWWEITPKLYLSPSLRLAKGNTYAFRGTPKIGLTYAWNDTTRLKFNYGKGFRAPSISELYLRMDSGHPVQVYGNPNLSPETSQSGDIGLEWERGNTAYGLSYFHQNVKNLIDTQYEMGHYVYVNRKQARIQGVEGTLSHSLANHWKLKESYTYLEAVDKNTHEWLDNRSRHTWMTSLSYEGESPYGWSGTLWDAFHGNYRFDKRSYTYHTVNLSLQKHWGKERRMTLGLYNIGNRKINDLYVNGREWYVGMEMGF